MSAMDRPSHGGTVLTLAMWLRKRLIYSGARMTGGQRHFSSIAVCHGFAEGRAGKKQDVSDGAVDPSGGLWRNSPGRSLA
jgi:hypothetical protein